MSDASDSSVGTGLGTQKEKPVAGLGKSYPAVPPPNQQILGLLLVNSSALGPISSLGPITERERERWLALGGHSWITPTHASGVPVTAAQSLGGRTLAPPRLPLAKYLSATWCSGNISQRGAG